MNIHQLNLMVKIALIFVVKGEVQDTDHINRFQMVIPFALLTLFPDRECRIVQTSVLEELLFSALHLNKDFLTLFILTIYIENCAPVNLGIAQMLRIEISQITNDFLTLKETIYKAKKQLLVHLRTEKHLETKIGVWINIFVF